VGIPEPQSPGYNKINIAMNFAIIIHTSKPMTLLICLVDLPSAARHGARTSQAGKLMSQLWKITADPECSTASTYIKLTSILELLEVSSSPQGNKHSQYQTNQSNNDLHLVLRNHLKPQNNVTVRRLLAGPFCSSAHPLAAFTH
jgi:hypothetical protein